MRSNRLRLLLLQNPSTCVMRCRGSQYSAIMRNIRLNQVRSNMDSDVDIGMSMPPCPSPSPRKVNLLDLGLVEGSTGGRCCSCYLEVSRTC
jgi:hypothetical protein